ncbi:glycosyltransferase family 2 protein [Streptococcus sp.]
MLSIIIPCYNCEKSIVKCYESVLKSIKHSSIENYEIIFINDGSSDKTGDILLEISMSNTSVVIINQLNNGVSSARNKGLKVAKGDWISFIDSDDTVNKNFFDVMMADNQEADIIVCGVMSKIHPKLNGGEQILDKETYINEILYNLNVFGYVWNKIYRKEIIQNNDIKFLDNVMFMEDKYFNLQCALYVKSVKFIQENLYNYFEPTTSAYGNSEKKATGLFVWDKLIADPMYTDYKDEFKKEKMNYLIWLLGQLYAEKANGREFFLDELKRNKNYINVVLSKLTMKYIQFKLLLISPSLVGWIVRKRQVIRN